MSQSGSMYQGASPLRICRRTPSGELVERMARMRRSPSTHSWAVASRWSLNQRDASSRQCFTTGWSFVTNAFISATTVGVQPALTDWPRGAPMAKIVLASIACVLVGSGLATSPRGEALAADYGSDRPKIHGHRRAPTRPGHASSTTLSPDAGKDPTGTRIPERRAVPPVPGSVRARPETETEKGTPGMPPATPPDANK